MLLGIGDSKPWIPIGCGLKEFSDGEMIADAPKSGNPALKSRTMGMVCRETSTLPPKKVPEDGFFMFMAIVYSFKESQCRRQEEYLGSRSFIYDALSTYRLFQEESSVFLIVSAIRSKKKKSTYVHVSYSERFPRESYGCLECRKMVEVQKPTNSEC
jgi:hypothetical protein